MSFKSKIKLSMKVTVNSVNAYTFTSQNQQQAQLA